MLTYTEPRTELFYRGAFYFVILFFIVMGTSFILFPLWVLTQTTSLWVLTLIWLIPVGVFIFWYIVKMWKQFHWKEKHLSSYKIDEGRLHGITYRPEWDHGVTQEVSLDEIQEVVIAPYIVRKNLNVIGPLARQRYGNTIEENAPMLVVRTATERIEILFGPQDYPQVDQWLRFFQDQQLPITHTPYRLYWLGSKAITPEQRDDYFNRESDRIPYEIKQGWLKDAPALYDEWNSVNAGGLRTELTLDEFEQQETKRKKKTTRRWLIGSLTFVGLVAIVLVLI